MPRPEFEEIGLRFRVTLRLARIATPQLGPLDQAILDHNTGRTTAELAVRHALPAPDLRRSSSVACCAK